MFNGKRILAIIPARGGSTGLKGKNIKPFNGKPMIVHSIEKSLTTEEIDRVIVTTDDSVIADIAKEAGAEIPFLREKKLARDDTPMVPVIVDAILRMQEKNESFDYALMMQANSPLTKRNDISSVLKKIVLEDMDVVFTVCETDHPPQWTLDINNKVPSFAFSSFSSNIAERRQDEKKLYRSTGAVFAVKITYLLENKKTARLCLPAENQKTGVVITDKISSIDIDNELDFVIAKTIKEYNFIHNEK